MTPSLLMIRSTSVGLATSVSEWTAGGCPGILLHRPAPPGPPPVPFLVWQAGAWVRCVRGPMRKGGGVTRIGAGACRQGGPSGPKLSPVDPAIAPRGLRLMGGGQGKKTKLTVLLLFHKFNTFTIQISLHVLYSVWDNVGWKNQLLTCPSG